MKARKELRSRLMAMCFAAESDVQAFIASLQCIFLISVALIAQKTPYPQRTIR